MYIIGLMIKVMIQIWNQ